MKERMCRQMSNDCCCCMMAMTMKGSVYIIIGKEFMWKCLTTL